MTLRAYALGWLLWRANAGRDPAVYAIKDRLLNRYGARERADDWQHIVYQC